MHLLVTAGPLYGSHLIRYFLGAHGDCRVTNLDSLTYAGNLANLRDLEDSSRYCFVKGDITDGDFLMRFLLKPVLTG